MKYRQFFFAQGDDARPFVDLLDDKGVDPLISYMDGQNMLNRANAPECSVLRGNEYLHEHSKTRMVAVVNYRFPYISIGERIRK